MRRWVKNPERLLNETLLHQVFLGVLLHDGIEVLFFPEQVPALAIDMNSAPYQSLVDNSMDVMSDRSELAFD
jgi:hypothetical protein